MRAEGPRGAGHRDEHAQEVPVEGERHLRDLLALNDAAGVGAIGLQHRRFTRDEHRLGQLADAQLHVHANRGVDVDFNGFTSELPESHELALDPVHAG